MAEYIELSIDQNSDFHKTITISDSIRESINLANYSPSSIIKSSPYSADSYSFDTYVEDIQAGVISLSMLALNTANIPANRYLYDVLIVGDGNTIRVAEGIVTVNPGITKISNGLEVEGAILTIGANGVPTFSMISGGTF